MQRSLVTLSVIALLTTACSDPQQTPPQGATATTATQIQQSQGETSQNALDWSGVYEGILPCASCEGIQTTLTLQADNRYELKSIYLGKDQIIAKETGAFTWNTQGAKITLVDGNKYLVGENQLFMLDREGNRITSELAEHYILRKKAM